MKTVTQVANERSHVRNQNLNLIPNPNLNPGFRVRAGSKIKNKIRIKNKSVISK